jgi:serine phosphatase RsbU (regulator of sigma subunit)
MAFLFASNTPCMLHPLRNLFLGILSCLSLLVSAQEHTLDSLLLHISKKTRDTAQVNLRIQISNLLRIGNKPANAMAFGKEALVLAGEIHDEKGAAKALLALAKCENGQSHLDSAIAMYTRCLEQFTRLSDLKGLGNTELGLGNAWDEKGNEEKALKHYILSLKAREAIGDSEGIANSLVGLGNVYLTTRQISNSLASNTKALGIYQRRGNKTMVSWLLNNIGLCYYDSHDMEKARDYFLESVKMKKILGDSIGLSTTYNNLINILSEQNKPEEAYHYALLAYTIRKSGEEELDYAISSNNLGMTLLALNQSAKAKPFVDEALRIGLKLNVYHVLSTAYQSLSRIKSMEGDWKEAYRFQDLAAVAKDSAFNNDSRKQITELSARYENQKKDQTLVEQEARIKAQIAESKVMEAEAKRNSLQRNIAIVALLFAMALAFLIYKGYKQKQASHAEISRQKVIIEIKNKETLDSIHYAQRIQKALLASTGTLTENLKEHFVIYKPKDIVSGDFYWAAKNKNQFLLCLADCTGHGVPGAFMSLLNISFLNEVTIEKQITRPDLVLNAVRTAIIHALNTEGNSEGQDGMDCIFCLFDFNTHMLHYAGANTNFYRIRNGTLLTSESDKMPVGKSPREQDPFLLHSLEFQEGDLLYLLTDGYADQFGGPKGKKFMYRQLEKVILENASLPLNDQRKALEYHFEKWRGDLEQIDDVTVIGIKV